MRKKIGIITGSGPEAGIDLWQKLLEINKNILKDEFRGDLDAPNVTILSLPELGHSMELEKNYEMVWQTLKEAVEKICAEVDYFVIACNTLNVYSKEIKKIGLNHKFISTADVIEEYIIENNLNNIGLIAALPVLRMDKYSVFETLNSKYTIETPSNFEKVHELIYGVKLKGGNDFKNDFEEIIKTVKSKDIFLACTELPLIPCNIKEKNVIDVTNLLAQKLIQSSF